MKIVIDLTDVLYDGFQVYKVNEDDTYSIEADNYLFTSSEIYLKNVELINNELIGEMIPFNEFNSSKKENSFRYNLRYDGFTKPVIDNIQAGRHYLKVPNIKFDYMQISAYCDESQVSSRLFMNAYNKGNDTNKLYLSLEEYEADHGKLELNDDLYKKSDFLHVRKGYDGCLSCNLTPFVEVVYYNESIKKEFGEIGIVDVGENNFHYPNILSLEHLAYLHAFNNHPIFENYYIYNKELNLYE